MAGLSGASYPTDFNLIKNPNDLPRQFGCYVQCQNGIFLNVRGPDMPPEGMLHGGREKQAWEFRFVDPNTVNILNVGRNAWMSAEKFLLQKGEVSCRCPFSMCSGGEKWKIVYLPEQGPNHFALRSAYDYYLSIDDENQVRAHEKSHIPEKLGRSCVFKFMAAPPPSPEALIPLTNLSLCVQGTAPLYRDVDALRYVTPVARCLPLVEGKNLAPADSNGLSDPYCTLKWGGKAQKTKAIDKSLNPVWNETLDFGPATKAEAAEVRTQVEVTVWDKDTLKDDFLGIFFVDLEDLEQARRTTVDKWYRLAKRKASDSVSGDVHLRIWFKDAYTAAAPKGEKEKEKERANSRPTSRFDLHADLSSVPNTPRSVSLADKPAEISDGMGIYVRHPQLGIYFIRAATLERIIEELTQDTGRMHDRDFVDMFLLTYRAFTSPSDLLARIIHSYDDGAPPQLAISRPRICVLLHRWIDNFWNDFSDSPEAIQRRGTLDAFINNRVAATLSSSAESLKQLILKRERKQELKKGGTRLKLFRASELIPKPSISAGQWNPERLWEMSATEIARQLTLIEHEMMCAIEMWEFMHQSWISKTKEKDAPHIVACIQRFNDVGQWVASSILGASADMRVALLEFFIRLAHECYLLRNYCGTLQVLSGLQTMPVLRLKGVWNDVNTKARKTFDDLSGVFLPESNWRQARELVHAATAACVPYLGIYLTDLVMLDEATPEYLDNTRMINVDKLRRFTQIIKAIRMLQLTRYALEPMPAVREYLMGLRQLVIEEDTMWSISYSILPKLGSRRGINILVPREHSTQGHAAPHPVSLAKLAHNERQSTSIPVPQEPLVRLHLHLKSVNSNGGISSTTDDEVPAVRVPGEEWHQETTWLQVLNDTAQTLRRSSTRQLLMRPPPPESPMPSHADLRESVDVGALDDLIDTLGEQQASKAIPERAPLPPARDKWVGGKVSFTTGRTLPSPPSIDKK